MKKWLENCEKAKYSVGLITQPRENQNESFRFICKHSQFVLLKGEVIKGPVNPNVVIQYPDGMHQYLSLFSKSGLEV